LVLRIGTDDFATDDVLEHFITRHVEHGGLVGDRLPTITASGH
jgi:hypothetical protein